jgi:K+-transporting ATPase KdpF subunit
MNGLYVLGAVVAILLAIYLFAALFKPERFG